jgi:hypothetical protein
MLIDTGCRARNIWLLARRFVVENRTLFRIYPPCHLTLELIVLRACDSKTRRVHSCSKHITRHFHKFDAM